MNADQHNPDSLDGLLRPFESLLNRGIEDSVDAARLCRELEGRSLRLELEGLPMAMRLTAGDGRLAVGLAGAEAADCAIGGLPISMLRLAVTGDQQDLRSGTVKLQGDPAIARDFQQLLNWAQRYTPIREEALFYVGAAWPALRRLALELGQRLVAAGSLDVPEDIFYLRTPELVIASTARGDGAGTPELAELARVPVLATPRAAQTAKKEETSGLAIAAAVPILEDSKLIGVLYGGDLLSRDTGTCRDSIGPVCVENSRRQGAGEGVSFCE